MYLQLIELLKSIQPVTTPLTLVAFLALILLAIVLYALPKPARGSIKGSEHVGLVRLALWLVFWLMMIALFGSLITQVILILYKLDRPTAPPNVFSSAADVHAPPQPPPPAPHEYKLVWFNHFEPNMLREVTASNGSPGGAGNQNYINCCASKPFVESDYRVYQRRLVAGDEVFKEAPPNWWTRPPYNLPELNQGLFHVMDDEKWYFYEVGPRESAR